MVPLRPCALAALGVLACACAPVQIEVRHTAPPLIEYSGPRPGIGVLAVDGTDANGSALVFDAI